MKRDQGMSITNNSFGSQCHHQMRIKVSLMASILQGGAKFMKASEMERLLANWDDDTDIYIETEDGLWHDFKFTERPATFDGFDTAYEAGINLIMTD